MFDQARATHPSHGIGKIQELRNASPLLAERQAQVPEELQRLNATLESLFSTVERLEQRLQPVLLPRPDESGKIACQPDEVTCSVAGAIRNVRHSIETIGQRLYSLTTSLEI